jgi:hypothetical protein
VPWPVTSETVSLPVTALYVVGAFAAIVGAVRSAPVSTTAIVIAAAACCTSAGTRFARVAANCHSAAAAPRRAATRETPRWLRATVLRTQRMPGRPRSVETSVAAISATWSGRIVASTCRPRSAPGES